MQMLLNRTERLTRGVTRWTLVGPHPELQPGQFAQVAVPGFYLRRPISICDWTEDSVTLVFRETGDGTAAMARTAPGTAVDLLLPLGHGFDPDLCGARPVLVGGGVGLPPLLGLSRCLLASGRSPVLLAGFRTASDCFLTDTARAMGLACTIVTEDGSLGEKGFVTDALPQLPYDSLCACGPLPILRALHAMVKVPAQYSLEERMGCGFGACMGC